LPSLVSFYSLLSPCDSPSPAQAPAPAPAPALPACLPLTTACPLPAPDYTCIPPTTCCCWLPRTNSAHWTNSSHFGGWFCGYSQVSTLGSALVPIHCA
jgi:hypothetical protein